MSSSPARTITMVDHDPTWADRFAEERDRLLTAVRQAGVEDEVVGIEHVGSTTVPGLAAKPVLDIMIGIRRFPASDAFVAALVGLGYTHRGELGIAGRHYFIDAEPGRPRTRHVHAVEHGSWFWREHLRFRDRLRADPADAAAYEEVKRELARRHPHDVIAYTEGKTETVRAILRRARRDAGTGDIHDAAARGFDTASDAYERARPGYAPEAIAHLVERLGVGVGEHLVDVGAGTGKLTRLLVPAGARITAVEPVAGMRRVLAETVPGVEVRDGTAEELPLDMASAHAIVAGQAFHWFDAWMALSEMYRVLLEDGRVGLVWNVRDDSIDWMARWTEIVQPVSDSPPRERLSRWREAVTKTSLFTEPETASFPNLHVVARETVIERVASTSFVAALDDDGRAQLLDEFRRMLDTHPQTCDRAEIAIPYHTEVHTFGRVS